MPDLDLFQRALGLQPPWIVVEDKFDAEQKRLDVRIDFAKGSRFPCPECERADCPVHDTETQTWRHLNFWQHDTYLTARVPRVECPEHGVRRVKVPWARPRSDFTLLFEAHLMAMVKEMPVAAIAKLVGEYDKKLWRVVHHYVDEAVEGQDLAGMQELGIDDTSFRRGQSYVSVFADLDPSERRAVFVADRRGRGTVEQFVGFLGAHGGRAENIKEVCQDMSGAYLAGVREHLKQAEVTFDRFHVKQKLSDAIDAVRRAEAKEQKELLRNTRYLWLKRPSNLSAKQLDWLDGLLQQPLKTARAYERALKFDHFYELEADSAEEYLRRWIDDVRDSDLEPLHEFADTLEAHWEGVLRWHLSRINNGLLEGLNSLIQSAKRRARGYRSTRNYKAMIYLVAGKLNAGPQLA